MADVHTPPVEVLDLLGELLDTGTTNHCVPDSDIDIDECQVCGEWDGDHKAWCPMPAIQAWDKATDAKGRPEVEGGHGRK